MMRRIRKILFYLFAAVVVLIAGASIYLAYMGGIERLANDRIRAMFAEENNLEIKIDRIGGDLFSGFSLHNVKIYYVAPQHRYQMAEIPHLKTSYSLANLWNRRYILNYLYIDSIDIRLRQDSTTGWQLPPLTRDESGPEGSPPSFTIEDVTIDNATVTLIRFGDTTHFERVALSGAIQADQGTYAAELDRFRVYSDFRDIQVDAAEGKVTYADKLLVFQDITATSKGSRVRADGRIVFADMAAGTIRFDGDDIDVADISDFLGPSLKGLVDVNGEISFVGKEVEGEVRVAGAFEIFEFDNLVADFRYGQKRLTFDSLYGSILGGTSLDGSGYIDFVADPDAYFFEGDIRNFDLIRLVGNAFPSNLTGHLVLNGESFREDELLLTLDVELFESSFDGYPIHEADGRLIVTTDSLVFAEGFRVGYYENVFRTAGVIEYSDDIALEITVDLNNLDRYRHTRFFIEEPGGRGYAEATLSGPTNDPDLRGIFVSDSVWVYGLYADTMYATVDIASFLNGREGKIEAWFHHGAAWDIPYDTGYTGMSIDSNLVSVDSAMVFSADARLTGHALLDYMADPQLLTVDDLRLDLFGRVFTNRSDVKIGIDTAGFIFNQAALGSDEALVSILGRINNNESMDFILAVERLPIEPWLHLIDSTLPVDGYLSSDASVEGTFREPRFQLHASVDSLTYKDLELGVLTTGMDYGDELLQVDSLRVFSDPGEYLARGSLYVDLALTADTSSRFPERPMAIDIDATDSRFDLVSLLLPSVEQLDGDFFADFRLFGNPNDPHIQGEAYIKNARLKYFDLENPIYADSAGVTMHDDSISIAGIRAYTAERERRANGDEVSYGGFSPIGDRARVDIGGAVRLLTIDSLFYDVQVMFRDDFPFSYELDDISGTVGRGGELRVFGATPPTVTGDIELVEVQYRVPFADQGSESPLLLSLFSEDPWDLNINIDILEDYWIENEDISAEFAGELNLIRTEGKYRIIGEMEILRGQGFLFDKTFRLEPGSRVTFQGGDTLNPRLDITGYTRVSAVRSTVEDEGPVTEQIEVCIYIGGTLDVPEIEPCAGSDLARSDLLPLIVANYYGDDGVGVGGQIEQRVFGLGYAQASQIAERPLRKVLGVETFEIDPVYGEEVDPWNAWVTVGWSVGDGLYVYGRSTIAGQIQQEYGFEYRWTRTLLLEGSRDEDDLYHLNLRLHWEW